MQQLCVICKKNITNSTKLDIEVTTMKKQDITIHHFVLNSVFELENNEHLFDDNYSCENCYDLLLKFDDYIHECETIQNLIISTYLEATEEISKVKESNVTIGENSTNPINDQKVSRFQDTAEAYKLNFTTSTSIVRHSKQTNSKEDSKLLTKKHEMVEFGLLPTNMKGPFCCELCGKTYQGRQSFKLHLKLHKNKNLFECKLCSRSFTLQKDLERHKVIHTGLKAYKCEICDKEFSYEASLQAHLKVHSGKRDFHCEICDKTFVFKQHLKRHMKTHTGEKTAVCSVCSAKFYENYNLIVHMKKHKL